jgi:hypothetical protein
MNNFGCACLTLLLGLLLLAGSCAYPEAGCYELVALDAYGLSLVSRPFMVEELTDDSQMTVGFVLLLPDPERGVLVEAPLSNSADLTRRAWSLALAEADTGAGELCLELMHAADRLTYSGAYRSAAEAVAYPVAGFTAEGGTGALIFNGVLPPLPAEFDGAASFALRPVSQEELEEYLGKPVGDSLRVNAESLEPFAPSTPEELASASVPKAAEEEPADAEEEAAAEEERPKKDRKKKPKAPPNLGGRK